MVPLFAGAILPSVGGLSETRHQRTETLIPSQRVPLQRAGHVQDSDTAGCQSAGGCRMAVLSTIPLRPGLAPEATDQSKYLLQNLSPQSSDRR